MATADLRRYLQALLMQEAERAYYGTAPSDAAFLYLVYNLEEVSFEDGLSLQELEVDVVDYGSSTAAAEAMADQLQAKLDHHHVVEDTFQAAIYRERRQPIYEDDKLIVRRRLTFQVRLHERSTT